MMVLDFDGVCTYGHREIVSKGIDVSDLQNLVRPGVSELIDQAQALGLSVAVLSNDLPHSWVHDLELLRRVDHVVICSDNGILKPDRRAFQRCLLVSGVEAQDTVLVDDHPDNVAVAASLGMTALRFDAESGWAPVREELGV